MAKTMKKGSIDFSKGATASRYFANTTPPIEEPKEEITATETITKTENKTASVPKKTNSKLGRPKKKEQDKSKKLPHTVYFEPSTEKQMEKYMQKKRIKKSDLIELALIEYMNNNP